MNQKNNSGIGFLGILTLVFITLKLLGKIDWSWWWVLSPVLIPTVLVALFLAFVLLMVVGERIKK